MKHRPISKRRRTTESVLRLLDLEHAKSAVLNSLTGGELEQIQFLLRHVLVLQNYRTLSLLQAANPFGCE